jgi:hypothetical protein
MPPICSNVHHVIAPCNLAPAPTAQNGAGPGVQLTGATSDRQSHGCVTRALNISGHAVSASPGSVAERRSPADADRPFTSTSLEGSHRSVRQCSCGLTRQRAASSRACWVSVGVRLLLIGRAIGKAATSTPECRVHTIGSADWGPSVLPRAAKMSECVVRPRLAVAAPGTKLVSGCRAL